MIDQDAGNVRQLYGWRAHHTHLFLLSGSGLLAAYIPNEGHFLPQSLQTGRYNFFVQGRPQDSELENSSKGWSVVDKALKNLDDSKIRDCKEDMDAILLFVSPLSCGHFLLVTFDAGWPVLHCPRRLQHGRLSSPAIQFIPTVHPHRTLRAIR